MIVAGSYKWYYEIAVLFNFTTKSMLSLKKGFSTTIDFQVRIQKSRSMIGVFTKKQEFSESNNSGPVH